MSSDNFITNAEMQPSYVRADHETNESIALGRSEPRRTLPWDEELPTYNTDLVICPNSRTSFPEKLLQNFVYSKNGELITEVWYDCDNGTILQLGTTADEKNDFGEHHARDDDDIRVLSRSQESVEHGQNASYVPFRAEAEYKPSLRLTQNQYARLLTVNWWYGALSSDLLIASAVIMGKNSLACFCVNLLQNQGTVHYPMNITERLFIIVFAFAIQILMVRSAFKRTQLEFDDRAESNATQLECDDEDDTNPAGDLVKDELRSCWDKRVPFYALLLFQVLEVNVLTRDIVKYLHPYKHKQPFAAFRADGHRAYLIGYQSEHAYRSKLSTLSIDELVLAIALETMLALCTVYAAVKDHAYSYMFYSLPSMYVICMKLSHAFTLVRHREHYWNYLRYAHQYGSESDYRAAEATRFREFSSYTWETVKLHEFWWLVLKLFGAFVFVFTGSAIIYFWDDVNAMIAHGLIAIESLRQDKKS